MKLRETRWFEGWEGMVPADRQADAEACIRQLIDEIIAMGEDPRKSAVRKAVERSIQRFNEIDEQWIMSTEREDIYYAINDIVDLTGIECDDFDDWFNGADW
jgi:hypothetical protein